MTELIPTEFLESAIAVDSASGRGIDDLLKAINVLLSRSVLSQ
jgi:hypothetical protein